MDVITRPSGEVFVGSAGGKIKFTEFDFTDHSISAPGPSKRHLDVSAQK